MELHFSPGVKGCEEDGSAPAGSGFRPASAEVSLWLGGTASALGTCCSPLPASGLAGVAACLGGRSLALQFQGGLISPASRAGQDPSCASLQKEAQKPEQGHPHDLAKLKGPDEADQVQQLPPPPAEPVYVQRRSPLIRNRKAGSMEVPMSLPKGWGGGGICKGPPEASSFLPCVPSHFLFDWFDGKVTAEPSR